MKKIVLIGTLIFLWAVPFAQVSISNDNSAPDPSAGLDVKFMNKGFLPPRMTDSEMLLISSPSEGLTVYNTTLKSLCWYDGTGWVSAISNIQSVPYASAAHYADTASVAGIATSVRYNGFTHMDVFDTPGTYEWSVTSGEMNVMVEVWGGGGGCGGMEIPGAGGGYAKAIFHFSSPMNSIIITVGNGGSGSSSYQGGNGETSSFGIFLYATGGEGGHYSLLCTYGGIGGGTGNILSISGESRCSDYNRNGGDSPNGGFGGKYFNTWNSSAGGDPTAANGVVPGGGGAYFRSDQTIIYGNGAHGRVVIYW